METRQVIPVSDEQTETASGQQAERYKQFVSLWEMEDMPACDVGMGLRLEFAMAHPTAYEMARKQGFSDLTHPMFATLPRWQAYVKHYTSCPKCNEV